MFALCCINLALHLLGLVKRLSKDMSSMLCAKAYALHLHYT